MEVQGLEYAQILIRSLSWSIHTPANIKEEYFRGG
jgi:hypothetical protein